MRDNAIGAGATSRLVKYFAGMAALTALLPIGAIAQDRFRDPPVSRIEAGTLITVRTNQGINSRRADGRIFTGTVEETVRGEGGRPAVPRGAQVELIVRVERDRDLILDLDSVSIDGQRYAIEANANRVDSGNGFGNNRRTGETIGGGAVLGSIIGAIAGGGKGAAIGAAAGAAAGATSLVLTRGRNVRVPAESLLTFRLERPLDVNVPDRGRTRHGEHYHDDHYRD